ncbi:MAG TPA: MarR family transcriptional regulator [Oleiagrimonas sp.]|nr:MarR family transcriptional regulator [Oleiagrimonas sp.]
MNSSDTNATQTPRSLGILLGQVKSELVRALEQELVERGFELRFSQVHALKHLRRLGPVSAGELARSLGHDAGAMTRLLDQLEDKGYLKRKPDPKDRRALRIELTAAGKTLCRNLDGCSERVLDAAQTSLDSNEREHLIDYLQRILATLRHPH